MKPENLKDNVEQLIIELDRLTNEFKKGVFRERHVLIIGGAGYIGSVLTRKLLSKGYKVRVLDKLLYDNGISISDLMEDRSFSFIHGDFGDEKLLESALSGITDVVLLAALVGDPICKKYPELARKTNLEYPKQLVQKLKDKNINRFVFTSTCSNYGVMADDTLAKEDSPLNPQSLYAETKVEFEKYILDNLSQLDYSPTILRLSTAFGMSNRMRFDLTISEFTRDLAIGKELLVYDENTWRPYCNVSDISNAIIKVLETSKERVFGQVFNIGSDNNNYTKMMILELVKKHLDNTKIEYKKGGFDLRNYRVSFDKAKKTLDFNTEFSAEDSIKQIISAVENNLFTDIESRRNFYGNYEINII
ncbi:MAG: NAD(P)-dependent oxidoreductase [Salinivirgaceae bacterium]|nr:NAD(P)-dependent oxidoreductase [Salinivirgaceae bacterium]